MTTNVRSTSSSSLLGMSNAKIAAAAAAAAAASSSEADDDDKPPDSLRIACLIPSATDICMALGLAEYVVGVTHECRRSPLVGERCGQQSLHVLTQDKIPNSTSQGEIHDLVQEASSKHEAFQRTQDEVAQVDEDIPSLYPIDRQALLTAAPTLIITQDLCNVCAPSSSSVQQALKSLHLHASPSASRSNPVVLSLSPHSLDDVLENIETVAAACGIRRRGATLRQTFQKRLEHLRHVIQQCRQEQCGETTTAPPRAVLLEWLDPPFDGGHWIPDMMRYAGLDMVNVGEYPSSSSTSTPHLDGTVTNRKKSSQISWPQIEESDPDVVVVACCGFDLDRNYRDAVRAASQLVKLRAAQQGNVWALDGDLYFARPGPHLVEGAVVLALCAHQSHLQKDSNLVLQALRGLDWIDWTAIESACRRVNLVDDISPRPIAEAPEVDMEDYGTVHSRACSNRESFYADPETGYQVFTEYAHLQRGKCCGSGCRHCPYGHENLKDKVGKIQQPAILTNGDDLLSLLSPKKHSHSKVLFFSGGKDSFLAIRAVVREARASSSFGLILLTTFDATSRMIAHQEMPVATAVRQAEHLGLMLVGVPMHRGSSESYVDRIRRALDLLEGAHKICVSSLVFGDLHLAHVVDWRKQNMSKLGSYELEFPLYQESYKSLLQDLDDSDVGCVVTASTVDASVVRAGDTYNANVRRKLADSSMDVMGENGEFHTEAQVWTTSRDQALGLRE